MEDIGSISGTAPNNLSRLAKRDSDVEVNGINPAQWLSHKLFNHSQGSQTVSDKDLIEMEVDDRNKQTHGRAQEHEHEHEREQESQYNTPDIVSETTDAAHIEHAWAPHRKETIDRINMISRDSKIASLPDQRKHIVNNKGASFSMIVCGESGTGKSTFIRALFGSEFMENCEVTDNIPMKMSEIVQTTKIEVYHQLVCEDSMNLDLTVVDTPGFGNFVNNSYAWIPVVNYIQAQNIHYMCQEEQPDRTQLCDTRVNLCIYFLPPTGRISELDVKAMQEIGARTNLIPIIAKADSMTPEDLEEQKNLIREAICENNICVYSQDGYEPPFSIVSSDQTIMTPEGKLVRGREYRWGIVDINNDQHSEFDKLRKYVFEKYMQNIIETTDTRFYQPYRRDMRIFRLAKVLSYGEDQESMASCEAEANTMSGIEILSAVSTFGEKSISSYFDEKDVLFKQRVLEIRKQFDIVLKFQQEKFDAQASQIEKVREELNREIAQANQENIAIVQQIKEMEARAR